MVSQINMTFNSTLISSKTYLQKLVIFLQYIWTLLKFQILYAGKFLIKMKQVDLSVKMSVLNRLMNLSNEETKVHIYTRKNINKKYAFPSLIFKTTYQASTLSSKRKAVEKKNHSTIM